MERASGNARNRKGKIPVITGHQGVFGEIYLIKASRQGMWAVDYLAWRTKEDILEEGRRFFDGLEITSSLMSSEEYVTGYVKDDPSTSCVCMPVPDCAALSRIRNSDIKKMLFATRTELTDTISRILGGRDIMFIDIITGRQVTGVNKYKDTGYPADGSLYAMRAERSAQVLRERYGEPKHRKNVSVQLDGGDIKILKDMARKEDLSLSELIRGIIKKELHPGS